MVSALYFAFLCLLASRVLAFSIPVNSLNLTTSEILNIPDGVVNTACNTSCSSATSAIQACGDDPACLCSADTVALLLSCEQCMFEKVIAINQRIDFRAGSQAVLTGYATSCQSVANITLTPKQTSLQLPVTWDGPYDVVLPFGFAIIIVLTGGFLGFSGLLLLSNISLTQSSAIYVKPTPQDELEALFIDIHAKPYPVNPASDRPSNSLRPTAAEQEWLQEEQLHSLSSLPDKPADRFDWRLRASSRIRRVSKSSSGREKYVRRKLPPLLTVEKDQPFYGAIRSYENRFLGLLAAEQAEDEALLKERLSSWSLARLKEEGYCLTGLSAFWLQANQFGRPVAAFLLGPGRALPDHRFENGTQILVSRIDPLQEDPIKGCVVSRTTSQIKVCFFEQFEVADGRWRLDVGRSNIVYERMRNAIAHLHQDPQMLEEADVLTDRQLILQGTQLRDVLLRTFDPSADPHAHITLQPADEVTYPPHEALEHPGKGTSGISDMGAFRDDIRIQSWARRYAEIDPVVVEGDPVLTGLNAAQLRAMGLMIGQRISLVQGPPGTGKTKTIIETVKLLKVYFEVPHPILVCTYTNVAVDNLVEGLVVSGVKPLRVGSGSNVRSSLLEHTLDHKLETHPLQPTLAHLVKHEEELSARMMDLESRLLEVRRKELDGTKGPTKRSENMQRSILNMQNGRQALKSKIYAMQQQMLRDVVSDADVICTTCITSASIALNVTDFPVVFLDEASMSTEPASLIPLMKGSRHVALIGDHKQLPPVITSREAQSLGLGISLFERLTEEGVVPSVMLDVQYRMHPAISYFPSSEFYNFTLRDGTVDSVGNISPLLLPPTSQHLLADVKTGSRPSVIFLDHDGLESMKDRSRVNLNEAHLVASVVEDLLLNNMELQGRDIGIIAPYVAQISLLTRLFNSDAKYRKRFKEVLGDHRAMQLANIEIKTVDGFEGRQKEIIIFSTVRNNTGGYIGFLGDRRRLNVGLTRAKRGLFVIGSISTLKTGRVSDGSSYVTMGKRAESWRRYANFLTEHGLVIKLVGESLFQALYGNLDAARARHQVAER